MNSTQNKILNKLRSMTPTQIMSYLKRKQSKLFYDIKTNSFTLNEWDNISHKYNIITASISYEDASIILYNEMQEKRRNSYNKHLKQDSSYYAKNSHSKVRTTKLKKLYEEIASNGFDIFINLIKDKQKLVELAIKNKLISEDFIDELLRFIPCENKGEQSLNKNK